MDGIRDDGKSVTLASGADGLTGIVQPASNASATLTATVATTDRMSDEAIKPTP
ncbi:MAG: hypothetical protein ABIP56_00615 [Dokdonella sp.]